MGGRGGEETLLDLVGANAGGATVASASDEGLAGGSFGLRATRGKGYGSSVGLRAPPRRRVEVRRVGGRVGVASVAAASVEASEAVMLWNSGCSSASGGYWMRRGCVGFVALMYAFSGSLSDGDGSGGSATLDSVVEGVAATSGGGVDDLTADSATGGCGGCNGCLIFRR